MPRFLGNKVNVDNLEAGTTEECTVNISDQSEKLPVISMGKSTANYSSSVDSYSSRLFNKASLMKFNVTTPSEAAICITGMNNVVNVNFGQPTEENYGFTYGMDTEDGGLIKMHGVTTANTETWAIVLPQEAYDEQGAEGTVYSCDNSYVGKRPVIHAIEVNKFYNSGIAMTVNTHVWNGDLSVLTANDPEGFATATDGMTIYGTLNANVKVSIADGATVTLSNATITGTNNIAYSWAGITCLGDATIMLADGTTNNVTSFYEDYPGIHIASGKTLTIQGSGTLNASSNGGADGWGAGIGGSDLVDCGNIVINNGTINATGGFWMAGIGGGFSKNCGSITINGGNVTATGGRGAAGIGTGVSQEDITCGDISITGGIVNATGGRGAAGIGSGFVTYNGIHNTCGNINITGGQVTATGGDGGDHVCPDILTHNSWANYTYYGGAGIGTGSTSNEGSSSCGTITIGSGVTSVTATKGSGTHPATNSIGKNHSSNPGTCGTITIGGTVYPSGATPNQGDGLTFVYPVPLPEGVINGLFSVSSTKQVYFSKGNLQYIGSAATPYWKFADHQWEYLGNNGQNSTSQTVDRDLFGWATSGYNHNNHSYQPWETNETQANYYAYNNQALNLWQENGQAEWGYNAISNGGNQENIGWHTLIPARWEYLFNTRTTSSGIRYAKAQVNGVNGMIMLPDDWNTSYYTLNSTNTANAKYNTNVISLENWNNVLEPHGAVFLPDAGVRVGTTIYTNVSCYWTSDQYYTYQNKDQCCNLWMHNTGFSFATMERYKGASVRLVIDAN